jgi:hypothetical protein
MLMTTAEVLAEAGLNKGQLDYLHQANHVPRPPLVLGRRAYDRVLLERLKGVVAELRHMPRGGRRGRPFKVQST